MRNDGRCVDLLIPLADRATLSMAARIPSVRRSAIRRGFGNAKLIQRLLDHGADVNVGVAVAAAAF